MNLIISNELKQFITPLSGEEKAMLRLSLLKEGCREPLMVWQKSDNEKVLIDGHNRYGICSEYDIPFSIKELKFKNKEEVKDWMIDNQLGRRNLNPDQMSYFRGLKYERLKQNKGGYEKVLSKGQSGPLTSELLAKEFNVSEKTIKRDAQYSRGIDRIGKSNPDLKLLILIGSAKIKKSDLQLIGSIDSFRSRKYKNLADLQNDISIIKKEHTSHAQENESISAAVQYLQESNPPFLSLEEKINRKKAQILSAINICIKNKDNQSINNLKGLVEEFEKMILSDD